MILAFLCAENSLNWAIRYILIVFPFLFIAVGKMVRITWHRRLPRVLIIACLMSNAVELLVARPYYLSFGNRMAGGIDGAQRVFLGSNFDWGQDLLRLKRWCEEHPQTGPIALSYYGVVEAKSIGLSVRGLPSAFHRPADRSRGAPGRETPEDFYWAVSSNVLNGLPGIVTLDDGSTFLGAAFSPDLKPENAIARVGSTIYIFRIASATEGSASIQNALSPKALEGCILDEHEMSDKVTNNKGFTMYTSP